MDVHSAQGERRIQVSIQAWLSYYNIRDTQEFECLIDDVVMVVDTFGDLLDMRKGWSRESGRVDAVALDNVVKAMVLVRAVISRDPNAIGVLRQTCSKLLDREEFEEIRAIDFSTVADEARDRVVDMLSDEDFVQLPIPLEDIAFVCICQVLSKKLHRLDRKLPPFLDRAQQEKQAELDTLTKACRELEVSEDRVWLLLNAPMYCDCIKRALLSLRPKQRLLLALHYYDNRRVPASDVLEALTAAGNRLTRDGSPLTENNIYRNLHYVSRTALPECLATEFAVALDRKVRQSPGVETANSVQTALKPFLKRSSGYLLADCDELRKLCKEGIGSEKGSLMGEEVIRVCRLLQGSTAQVSDAGGSCDCKDRGERLI